MAEQLAISPSPARLATRWLAWLLAAVVAAWVWAWGSQVVLGDSASTGARYRVKQWLHGEMAKATDVGLDRAQQTLQEALVHLPDDPDLYEKLADLQLVRAWRLPPDSPEAQPHFKQAIEGYATMTRLRPADPSPWAMLALARQQAGEPDEAIFRDWNQALQRGPYERHLQPLLWQVVVARWDSAPPPARQWAERLFEQADERKRLELNGLAQPFGLQFEAPAAVPEAPPAASSTGTQVPTR